MLLAACTPGASATERFKERGDNDSDSGPVAPVIEMQPSGAASAGVVATVPARTAYFPNVDASLAPVSTASAAFDGSMSWQFSATTERFVLDAVVDLTFDVVEAVASDDPVTGDDTSGEAAPPTAYRVVGSVHFVEGSATCASLVARTQCAVSSAIDASIEGTAEVVGDDMVLGLRWRGFGPEDEPGRVGLTVGEWNIGAAPGSRPYATTTLASVADGLDQAGVFGTRMVINLLSGRPVALESQSREATGAGELLVSVPVA
jgi:hypothetical protein